MIRKQVQFTQRQASRIRREAAGRGISESAVIREALERGLSGRIGPTDQQWERAMSVVGIAASGHGEIAADHDRYLADDLYDEIRSKQGIPGGQR